MLLNHDGLVHNEDFLLGQHVQGELIDPLHDIRCVDAGAPQTGGFVQHLAEKLGVFQCGITMFGDATGHLPVNCE